MSKTVGNNSIAGASDFPWAARVIFGFVAATMSSRRASNAAGRDSGRTMSMGSAPDFLGVYRFAGDARTSRNSPRQSPRHGHRRRPASLIERRGRHRRLVRLDQRLALEHQELISLIARPFPAALHELLVDESQGVRLLSIGDHLLRLLDGLAAPMHGHKPIITATAHPSRATSTWWICPLASPATLSARVGPRSA